MKDIVELRGFDSWRWVVALILTLALVRMSAIAAALVRIAIALEQAGAIK